MIKAVLRSLLLLSLLLVIAAAIYGSYRLLRATDLSIPTISQPGSNKRALMSMEGVHMVQSESERETWSMSARTAELFENKEAQVKDIEIVVYHTDNRTVALLGEMGTIDTVSGNATIQRGTREVRIVTSDGYLMTTDSLVWKAGERVIKTVNPFRVLGKEIYLEGKGMSADVDLRKVIVDNNVKAVLQE
jgi:LPS export ABC transporter protein LptC